eukprot:gene20775-27599_t
MVQVKETPEAYQSFHLPYVKAIPPSRMQWVYNVLEKKKEVDRLLFEDEDPSVGFMLHPDLKWDQQQMDQLYCLAICHRKDIPCLRELTADHLPLLENIRDKGSKAIRDKFGVAARDLRIWVHYLPSYYHFHVHLAHVKWIGVGVTAGKAHLLDDVIDNIRTFGSDYYQRRTLTYVLGEEEPLWDVMLKAGVVDSS